jgi:heavy metal sensor kinase
VIDTVRTRLTLWYVSLFGVVLIVLCAVIYLLLARALYERIDDNLRAVAAIAFTSLTNDLSEGQTREDAARSTAAELSSRQLMLAIYDIEGRLLAEEWRDDDLDEISLPPLETIPMDRPQLFTITERLDDDDRHRMAIRRASIAPSGTEYVILLSTSIESTDEELESLRGILMSIVPGVLVVAGIVGWFLARHSLSPVMLMADRARKMSIENLSGRLPVANPRDELGRLAATFNELLDRLAGSFSRQRQFMADASHELRTPVATARTAATVALQQPHRPEEEYRETLHIIEQQTVRLSRIVEDMFTLARADAGNYPLQRQPMYLDEVVEDVVRAARVLASNMNVSIDVDAVANAPFLGDEELIRRLIGNVLDNGVKHAAPGSAVRLEFRRTGDTYTITVANAGQLIPVETQAHIFERFYRGDAARTRTERGSGGAGLGLAIARWVARLHGGEVSLVQSTAQQTVFRIDLPYRDTSQQ